MLGVGIGKVFPAAKSHHDLPLTEIDLLLYHLYMNRHDRLNNWDLVERAAPEGRNLE